MTDTSTIRADLEEALNQVFGASKRLLAILCTNRGLTVTTLVEIQKALDKGSGIIDSLVQKAPVKPARKRLPPA